MTTDLAKRACVFCNGQLENPAKARKIAIDCDLMIAVDGGAKYFVDIGLSPQVIIGDMVSIDPTIRTSGLRYPLQDQSLRYPTHGLSNELSQTQACVCVKDGIILVSIKNDGAFISSTAAAKER